jgi:23S rRNA pseudouridine2605 synthase
MTGPAQVKKVRKVEANSWLEITIREGRKHQVKRMLEAVGHPVIKLLRIRMGSLSLGDLQPGEFRFLTDREANALRQLVDERVASVEGSPTANSARRPEQREGWARPKKLKRNRGRRPLAVNR